MTTVLVGTGRRLLLPCWLALLSAACVSGCATPSPRVPESDDVMLEKTSFYWQYAALAAHVYDSKGVVDGQLGLALTSQWMRREVRESQDAAVKQRYEAIGTHGLVALYESQRREACLQRQTDRALGAGLQPDQADACNPDGQSDDEAKQQAEERSAEPNRFKVATPDQEEKCDIGGGNDPSVPLDKAISEFGWEPVAEFQKFTPSRAWTVFVPDLAIDVWRRPRTQAGDAPTVEYAIVYRGTVGGGGWVSNLRAVTAVTPFVWDQYRQARQATTAIVRQIDQLHTLSDALFGRVEKSRKTRVLITAVGHSLGAGLASYMYISNNRISRVVGFDPSPVDGSSTIKIADRAKVMRDRTLVDRDTRDPQASVYLLYERGEFISRVATCHSGALWGDEGGPDILCENVDFSRGSWFKQHSMSQLACNLYLRRAQIMAKRQSSN